MLRSRRFYSYDSIKLGGGSLPKTTPFQPGKSGFPKIYCLPCFNSYDLGERLAGTSLKPKAIEIRVFLLFLFFYPYHVQILDLTVENIAYAYL